MLSFDLNSVLFVLVVLILYTANGSDNKEKFSDKKKSKSEKFTVSLVEKIIFISTKNNEKSFLKVPDNIQIETINTNQLNNAFKIADISVGSYKDYFQIDTNNLNYIKSLSDNLKDSQLYILLLNNNAKTVNGRSLSTVLSDAKNQDRRTISTTNIKFVKIRVFKPSEPVIELDKVNMNNSVLEWSCINDMGTPFMINSEGVFIYEKKSNNNQQINRLIYQQINQTECENNQDPIDCYNKILYNNQKDTNTQNCFVSAYQKLYDVYQIYNNAYLNYNNAYKNFIADNNKCIVEHNKRNQNTNSPNSPNSPNTDKCRSRLNNLLFNDPSYEKRKSTNNDNDGNKFIKESSYDSSINSLS